MRRRHRLDHRAQLHRLRAALQRHDLRALRGRARTSRTRTAGGRSSSATASTILYTAPTAIRSHMKWGPEHAEKHDLSSLRLLGSVGEPINPEAWVWYREHIGGDRTPVVDTWWQTETGMILITPLPGRDDAEAGLGDEAVPGRGRRGLRRAGQRGRPGRGRLPRAAAAVAGDAARDLQRRRALPRDVLVAVPGRLLRRRRRADRRGRRLLAARPRRRRDERLRPPHLDDRGRERARRPPGGGRGRGVRRAPTRRPGRRSSPT